MHDTIIVHQPGIAGEILAAHAAAHAAAASALEHARQAGVLLIEAKAAINHGSWLLWLEEHVPGISPRMAQNYIRVASQWAEIEKRNGVSPLSLREALSLLAEPRQVQAMNNTEMSVATEAVMTTIDTDICERRNRYAESRKAEDQPNRILERCVETAISLLNDGVFITDEHGKIRPALIAGLDPLLCPVWASELRQAAKRMIRLAAAIEASR